VSTRPQSLWNPAADCIRSRSAKKHVIDFVRQLELSEQKRGKRLDEAEVEVLSRRYLSRIANFSIADKTSVTAVICVFSDLAKLGWHLTVAKGKVFGLTEVESATQDRRESRRLQLSARRNEQLREPATREFIRSIEAGHVFKGHLVSIFNLMRDGRALAQELREVPTSKDPVVALMKKVKPYIQFADRDIKCEQTGFMLQDIWRYFRHTWANAYESVPGRSMLILVRDAAAAYHPVIGIASIASAAAVHPARDAYIGWNPTEFLADCALNPSNAIADWIDKIITHAIDELYKSDFVQMDLIPGRIPKKVSSDLIAELRKQGLKWKDQHMSPSDIRSGRVTLDARNAPDELWEMEAKKDLFKSKRAIELANLLEVRNVVSDAYAGKKGKVRLVSLMSTAGGRNALQKVLRMARADSIGTAIADLMVCGAVAPYNELLGGKLVAALAVAPEVIEQYKRRYGAAASVIASSMSGRRIVRRADLVFIGTTSIYGTRPSQYDRISIPCDLIGGKPGDVLRYKYLANTKGMGSFQFGPTTKQAIEKFVEAQENSIRRINNVFGEGANPKIRALRDGLTKLGFGEELLVHGLEKCAYGVSLISNLRDYLLGIAKRPSYVYKRDGGSDASLTISTWWASRWVLGRLQREDVLEKIGQQTLIKPVQHGARVILPEADVMQMSLI
jgi:hypothetical protein